MTPTQTKIAAIVSRWIVPPREITSDDTLADLGLSCEAVLVSISCDVEEQILGREFRDPTVIHKDMTLADLAGLVEGEV